MYDKLFILLVCVYSIVHVGCKTKTVDKNKIDDERDYNHSVISVQGHNDDELYINRELDFKVLLKFPFNYYLDLDNLSDEVKLFNRELNATNWNKDLCHELFYAEYFDHERFGFLAEVINSPVNIDWLLSNLNKYDFIDIEVTSDSTITYSKYFELYEYYFNEYFFKKDSSFIRLISFGRSPIKQSEELENEAHRVTAEYKKYEKNRVAEILQFTIDNLSLQKISESEDNINYFRNSLGFNYSWLNNILNNEDSISTINQKPILLSFLSRNREISDHLSSTKSKRPFKEAVMDDAKHIEVNKFINSTQLHNTSVIIINESHHYSQCRQQFMEILPLCKDLGFNNIFIEGINNDKARVANKTKSIDQNIGLYTSDPVFANMIKKAIDLNYNIYGYEIDVNKDTPNSDESRIQMRERIQANNIFQTINENINLKDDKILIYCGYSHASELPQRGINPMASILKDSLNQDIISINQSDMIGYENDIASFLNLENNKAYLLTLPVLNRRGYDYYLIENNKSHFTNNPDYVYDIGHISYKIACKNLNIDTTHFIVIYDYTDDNPFRIPVFAKQYSDSHMQIKLGVGKWFMQVFSNRGAELCSEIITIK